MSPYEPYPEFQSLVEDNKGKGKGPSIVPESSSYGFGFLLVSLLIVVGITKWKKQKRLTSKNN